MPPGSGLSGQLMMGNETTHGTYATPTRGYEIRAGSGEFGLQKGITESAGLRATGLVQRGNRRRVATRRAEGSFTVDVMPRGLGILLRQIFGGTVTPVQVGSTDAYTQTYTLQDMGPNLGATIQLGVPDAGGTVHDYSYLGSRCVSATFTQEGGETPPPLALETSWHIRNVTEAQTLVTFVDPAEAEVPFAFADWECLIGEFGSEAAIDGIAGWNLAIGRGQKTDRYYANDAGLRRAPILNALTELGGSLTSDLLNKADLFDLVESDGQFSMINRWTGREIDTGENCLVEISTPMCFLNTGTPSLAGGFEVVSGELPYVVRDDDTNAPITVTYTSLDTTL
ncbi:hypothetical protein [Parafrankia soli]|nr:hypothetical protein [Parafrankia soli]